jgi:hypothetical protein
MRRRGRSPIPTGNQPPARYPGVPGRNLRATAAAIRVDVLGPAALAALLLNRGLIGTAYVVARGGIGGRFSGSAG